jgi:hypothetical protein
MDPKVVKILHDAFRKGMEESVHVKTLEKLDMELFYKGTEDYVKYAKEQTDPTFMKAEESYQALSGELANEDIPPEAKAAARQETRAGCGEKV